MKLSIAVFAFLLITSLAAADGVAESNPTTDSMSAAVDAGVGETFLCSDLQFFSCTTSDDSFTCYGWSNCEALGAPTDAPGFEVFEPADAVTPTAAPEPSSLVLLVSGLAVLLFRKR
jgi:hypothetical protein